MNLKDKIHTIRDKQVMLDRDLAELYGVETKYLNKAVKRNIKRFPEDFCFRLTEGEYKTIKEKVILRFQNGTIEDKRGKHMKYLPFVFSGHGIVALPGVLNSDIAIRVNIKIIKTFIELKRDILHRNQIFQKFQQIDQKFIAYDEQFNEIFEAIESKQLTPTQGVFYDGQIYDAYKFIKDLANSAKESIVLIDNYINEETLTILCNTDVKIKIYTKEINRELRLAKDKFNQQYGNLEIIKFEKSHDRFLIIDNVVYHIGASLKDVGKKWFAFSKINLRKHMFLP